MTDFIVAIPARFASRRLPGKVLRPINGKPMIHHVVDRALESGAERVVVATDSERVVEALDGLAINVCMTSSEHRSGTERLAECASLLGWRDDRIVVNLQGDEPLLPGAWLRQAARDLEAGRQADIATLCHRLERGDDVFNPNIVKVVMTRDGHALYFSRAPIPWHREHFSDTGRVLAETVPWFRHIGVYAYRVGALREIAQLTPTALEQAECLEQLRALEYGYRIQVRVVADAMPPGVDTDADLKIVEKIMRKQEGL